MTSTEPRTAIRHVTSHPQWQVDPLDHLGLSPLFSPPLTRTLVLVIVGTVAAALSCIELAAFGSSEAADLVATTGRAPALAAWLPSVLAIATALLTAWLGLRIGSPRLGLLAGLIVAANPEMMIVARSWPQALLATFVILLSFACFVAHYLEGSRPALLLCYAAVGLSGLAPHPLALIGPLATFALFLALTQEPQVRHCWLSWVGLALLITASLSRHLLVEGPPWQGGWAELATAVRAQFSAPILPPGRQGAGGWLVCLGLTAAGFLPWCLVLPYALASAFSRPCGTRTGHLWLLLALWVAAVLLLTVPPPLYGPHLALVMFPQMALLVARVWDEVMVHAPRAPSPHLLLAPALVVISGMGLLVVGTGSSDGAVGTWAAPLSEQAGLAVTVPPSAAVARVMDALRHRQAELAVVCWFGSLGLAVALLQRHAAVGFAVLLAVATACLVLLGTTSRTPAPAPPRLEGRLTSAMDGPGGRYGYGRARIVVLQGTRLRVAERPLHPVLGPAVKAGGGRSLLGVEAVGKAAQGVVDEANLLMVATAEHTDQEVRAKTEALPEGQVTVERLRDQGRDIPAGIEQRMHRSGHETGHHGLNAPDHRLCRDLIEVTGGSCRTTPGIVAAASARDAA